MGVSWVGMGAEGRGGYLGFCFRVDFPHLGGLCGEGI